MSHSKQPVYMIGVASELCGIHPQTLRQYEKLGLISPARVGAKNRLYSDEDIARVRKIQRLTQDMGVNLAGVEIILKLLDEMEEQRAEMEENIEQYIAEVEQILINASINSNSPARIDGTRLPVPKFPRRREDPI